MLNFYIIRAIFLRDLHYNIVITVKFNHQVRDGLVWFLSEISQRRKVRKKSILTGHREFQLLIFILKNKKNKKI